MRSTLWGNASVLKTAKRTFGESWFAPTLRCPLFLKMTHPSRYFSRVILEPWSWASFCCLPSFLMQHIWQENQKNIFLPWLSLRLWIEGVQTQSSGVAFTREIIYLGVNFACPIGFEKMAQLWPLRTWFEHSSCRTALKKALVSWWIWDCFFFFCL